MSVLWERGRLYRDGRDLPKDLDRARQLFRQACTEGEGLGCVALADLAPGEGAKLLVAGRRLLETNCAANVAPACHALARMLLDGTAGSRDEDRGQAIIDRLCEAWSHGGEHFPECDR